jgi:hypothetical protein
VVSLFGVLMPKGEKVPFACVSFGVVVFHLELVGSQALIVLARLCPMCLNFKLYPSTTMCVLNYMLILCSSTWLSLLIIAISCHIIC